MYRYLSKKGILLFLLKGKYFKLFTLLILHPQFMKTGIGFLVHMPWRKLKDLSKYFIFYHPDILTIDFWFVCRIVSDTFVSDIEWFNKSL